MPDPCLAAEVSIAKLVESLRLQRLIAFAGGLFLGLFLHMGIEVVGRLIQ